MKKDKPVSSKKVKRAEYSAGDFAQPSTANDVRGGCTQCAARQKLLELLGEFFCVP